MDNFLDKIPVYDLIFAVILLVSILFSAKRGAFRAISGIAGTILGCIGAFSFLDKVQPFTERVLLPYTRRLVEKSAEGAGVQELLESEITQDILGGLSNFIGSLGFGSWAEDLAATAQEIGGNVLDAMAASMARQIAPVITFIALFVLIKLGVSIILSILSLDIPVLRTINRAAGGLLGALSGLVIIFVLCWGVARFAPEEELGFVSRPALEQSRIGGFCLRLLSD